MKIYFIKYCKKIISKGVNAWLCTYPFDTAKTIIQGGDVNNKIKQIQVFRNLIEKYGVKSLFKGLAPTLSRGFLTNSVVFYVNEMCQDMAKNLNI